MSTIKATNFQHASAANPAIVLAVDGSATANVSAINGGPLAGFRNAIINGNFDHWQRGTSHASLGYGSADRWYLNIIGSSCTMSRQAFTLGQTAVPDEPTYFCRAAVTSVAGANNITQFQHRIEDVRTFAGRQVTVSFWAKADATKNIAVELLQVFGTGGSPSTSINGIGTTKVSIGTDWQKVTVTTTLPSISSKVLGSDGNHQLQLNIWFDAGSSFNARTDTLGHQSGTFDIAQVQVEPGPVATPFERRPIGTELSLCQRYYYKTDKALSISAYASAANQGAVTNLTHPVTMRAAPTVSANYTIGLGSPTQGVPGTSAIYLSAALISSAAGYFSGAYAIGNEVSAEL